MAGKNVYVDQWHLVPVSLTGIMVDPERELNGQIGYTRLRMRLRQLSINHLSMRYALIILTVQGLGNILTAKKASFQDQQSWH